MQFQPLGRSFIAEIAWLERWTTVVCVSISERISPASISNTIVRDAVKRHLATFFGRKESSNGAALACIAVGLFLFLNSCSLPTSTDLIVTSLRCAPSAFDSFRANSEIRYTLAKPATVTIYIAQRNASGQLVFVNTLVQNIYETKGSHGHTWLGDTAAGLFAESGLYIAVLQIESTQYETSVRVFHF
ncbi:MAG: hypothetical protein ABI623_03730 [bacterium]